MNVYSGMEFFNNLYSRAVLENERNLRFWEDYLKSLEELNFKVYSEKLTVPVLVPIGSRILFRGELKHTNEVTASIGADYLVKCSIAQADILRQHRIKDAKSKVDMYRREREYLENQSTFRKENIYEDSGHEIVEDFSEDEEIAWQIKHRENLRQYKIRSKNEKETESHVTDEELWNRLEELELQEELENELDSDKPQDSLQSDDESIGLDEVSKVDFADSSIEHSQKEQDKGEERKKQINEVIPPNRTPEISKLDLLQKVINRQNELDEKLQELRNKERSSSRTEKDLMSRLDEMEQLDELEDEMDRLDNIITGEDEDSDEDTDDAPKIVAPIVKRSVSFADEDESETIEITFKHSEMTPSTDGYDPKKGIQKPSDIYSAYCDLFNETTSILKKKKYTKSPITESVPTKKQPSKVTFMQTEEDEDSANVNRTIVVGDIVERVDQNGNMLENTDSRPRSLFKQRRMQKNLKKN